MKQVRLVAYRKATTSSTTQSSYELDLQENPSVSLNFQFSDIKEPETRKASYSQTFKLPFTDNNNKFFQNWFNVNLDTLVFTARKKFDATLFVGATPQFEGIIQLKAVYQQAQLYEVVLMSNTADLFTMVGNKKLKDVFKNENGSYSTALDHVYTQGNITDSWNGASDSFENSSGDPLQDVSAGVQKLMYPMSLTKPNFYYNQNAPYYLNMTSSDINNTAIFPDPINDPPEFMVPINQLRPAIQIKYLLNKLITNAGFTYTSTFIDGSYFGKIFMTTGNHLAEAGLPVTDSSAQQGGSMNVGNSSSWGYTFNYDNGVEIPAENLITDVPANTTSGSDCISDESNAWNSSQNYFKRESETQMIMTVRHKLSLMNMQSATPPVYTYPQSEGQPIRFKAWLQGFNLDTLSDENFEYGEPIYIDIVPSDVTNDFDSNLTYQLDLTPIPPGQAARIKVTIENMRPTSAANNVHFGSANPFTCADLYSKVQVIWPAWNEGAYNQTINVPACIDESILQKDFLTDIIQRFNLVIIPDKDNPTNLIIETYDDYLDGGTIKSWSNKLDTSKEIIVKDTTSIQKHTIHLTDQEDVDLANKTIKEKLPSSNVYGHYKRTQDTNEFAQGELKNKSIFAPYINGKVQQNEENQLITQLLNMAVHYEFTYKLVEGGAENPIEATKPKLFYYCGTPTAVLGSDGNALSGGYNMHHQPSSNSVIAVYNFTTYPLCTPYDITPSSNEYTLTQANKSLYWNANPPLAGDLTVFNYTNDTGSWFDNSLYGLYWKSYLDGIYSPDSRIMECHLTLDEVDIHNFNFNDEIFIKDSYWRIINIHNYQVGQDVSTKVTLLKITDTVTCEDCDYVIGTDSSGFNLFYGLFYYWCPDSEPNCTPSVSSPFLGIMAPTSCCECYGGQSLTFFTLNAASGLYPCLANVGSFPLKLKEVFGLESILSLGQTKTIFNGLIGKQPLRIGSDTDRFSSSILRSQKDDIIIKYKPRQQNGPKIQGEMHRMILTGFTEGTTRGYAFPEGSRNTKSLMIPNNTNMLIRVSGIVTVVGGTSSTYVVGTTDSFAYYTSFVNKSGTVVQQGTAGGTNEFNLHEGVFPTTCTLNIVSNNGTLEFGLDDDQTDTKRMWQLTVDLSVQEIHALTIPVSSDYAIFQNADNILFENGNYLLWN